MTSIHDTLSEIWELPIQNEASGKTKMDAMDLRQF